MLSCFSIKLVATFVMIVSLIGCCHMHAMWHCPVPALQPLSRMEIQVTARSEQMNHAGSMSILGIAVLVIITRLVG